VAGPFGKSMKKILLFLPAYNEAENITSLLERVQGCVDEYSLNLSVLVANDGSSDNTLNMVETFKKKAGYKIEIIDIQPNQGLANAMRLGIEYGVKNLNQDDLFVAMDADDSHSPFLIKRMNDQINEGSDIVIASRFQPGARISGLSGFRKFTSVGAGLIFKFFVDIPHVKDYTCGFRAYRVSLLQDAIKKYDGKLIEEKGFACMAEILLKLSLLNPIIHEVPMILRYDRKGGASKMNVYNTIRQTLYLIRNFKRLQKN
jgi:dolichol-phosphate mannosyltransferase